MSNTIYTRTINPEGTRFCNSPWNTVSITNDNRPGWHRPGDVQMCMCRDWQTAEPIGNMLLQYKCVWQILGNEKSSVT